MTYGTPRLRLDQCNATHSALLHADPEFADWLDREYVPIAGGWHY